MANVIFCHVHTTRHHKFKFHAKHVISDRGNDRVFKQLIGSDRILRYIHILLLYIRTNT